MWASALIWLLLVGIAVTYADQSSGIPSQAAKITSNILTGALKGTKKASYFLVQPKHVELEEVYGLWRLDLDDGGILNLEVTPKHVVLVDPQQKDAKMLSYEFKMAKWPLRARIEFQTKQFAYQVVLHRKVAARNVLKLKGTIRRIGRWGSRRDVAFSFRGKRRLKLDVEDDRSVDSEEEEDSEVEESEDEEALDDDNEDDMEL